MNKLEKPKILILIVVLVVLVYAFFLIPNFNKCRKETGSWRACTQWIIE